MSLKFLIQNRHLRSQRFIENTTHQQKKFSDGKELSSLLFDYIMMNIVSPLSYHWLTQFVVTLPVQAKRTFWFSCLQNTHILYLSDFEELLLILHCRILMNAGTSTSKNIKYYGRHFWLYRTEYVQLPCLPIYHFYRPDSSMMSKSCTIKFGYTPWRKNIGSITWIHRAIPKKSCCWLLTHRLTLSIV